MKKIYIIGCIFVMDGANNKCGFFEDENKTLYLPAYKLEESSIVKTAISLFQEIIDIPIDSIDVVQCGFFEEEDIFLCYKANIMPGTPVNKNLIFMDYDQVYIAKNRIKKGHCKAYKYGLSK